MFFGDRKTGETAPPKDKSTLAHVHRVPPYQPEFDSEIEDTQAYKEREETYMKEIEEQNDAGTFEN